MINPLPSMEHTFTVKIDGSRTGKVYEGTFTYTIPNLHTETLIDKTLARLTEGLQLSEDITFLYEMVSYLGNTLSETPEWWSKKLINLDTLDYNVYTELYKHCLKFKQEWETKVLGEDDESSKTESEKTDKVS